MSTEFVTVGCRLPNGVTLEVGYTASVRPSGGAPFARYSTGTNYRSITLKGSNQHLLVREPGTKKIVTTLPGRRNGEPFINQVPKEFWDEWMKKHARDWLITSKQLFVVPKPDATEIDAAKMDAQTVSAPIFQPMDPNAIVDLDGAKIEKRTDE